MLKSLAKVSNSGMLSRLHLNLRYLGVSEHLEILDCPSSADSGTCHVYLLPVIHFSVESRKAALSLIAFTRPQLVYLELDSTRDIVLNDPENEMAVANKTAKALGLDVFQGDISEQACSLFQEDIMEKIGEKYYSGSNDNDRFEIERMANDKAKVDVRNRLMINDIWQLAKHRESIVGIVGSDHLYGMVHHWKHKKMGFLGMDAEAVVYKNFLLKYMIQHAYDKPKGEDPNSLMGRAYYMQKQIRMFHPEELDKLKQMKEQLLAMKIFYPSQYNQMRLPGAEEYNLYTKKLSGVEPSLARFTSIPSGSLLNILDQEDNILGDFSISRRSSQPLQSNWQAILEFDWELDELEEFTDKLIETENLSEDQKDALKEFLKRKVREGKCGVISKGKCRSSHYLVRKGSAEFSLSCTKGQLGEMSL